MPILQILTQMTQVHRRTFVFLVKFMKNLLKHSEQNGLDSKVLGKEELRLLSLTIIPPSPIATIFGEVLLRTALSERRSKSRRQVNAMNRKKATFLYQFLVNDLT